MKARRPKRKRAVAIKGPESDEIPAALAAKGEGALAEKIIALAREHGIPVKEDPDLVGLLAKLDLEQAIPADLYPLIAELLGFAYRINQAAEGEGAEAKEKEAAASEEEAVERRVTIEPGQAVADELPLAPAITDRSDRTTDEERPSDS